MSDVVEPAVVELDIVAQVESQVENQSDDQVEDQSEDQAEDQPEDQPEKQDKVQKRINALIRQKHEDQRKIAELEARVKSVPTEQQQYDPDIIQSLVQEEAFKIAEATRFNEKCNTIFENGVGKYSDFKQSAGVLGEIGIFNNSELFNEIVNSETPVEIIKWCADNLDKAEELLSMSLAKQVRFIAKLESQLEANPIVVKAKPVSNAPAPIKPVTMKGSPVQVSVDKDPAAWVAQRNAELASRSRR